MNVVYAISNTSVTNAHGVIYRLNGGEAWDADDPIVQMYPDLFSEIPVKARTSSGWEEVVETATAEPGKKRRTRRG